MVDAISLSMICSIIPILVMIVMLLRSSDSIEDLLPCCVLDSRSSPPAAQEQAAPVPSAPRVETEEERKQARRLKILTTLVHKKVLAKDDAKDELALPHLAEISKRSLHEIIDLDNGESTTKQHNKTNLFVDFTSWRSIRRLAGAGAETSEDEESSNLYSPTSCPICLEPYREGDDICWSQNENCAHAYHVDCIVDWLMNSDECPLCRADYLKVENGDGGSLIC